MLKPYDILCELLALSQGSKTDGIKSYFKNFTDDQVCVACISIICDQSLKNIKVCTLNNSFVFSYVLVAKYILYVTRQKKMQLIHFWLMVVNLNWRKKTSMIH